MPGQHYTSRRCVYINLFSFVQSIVLYAIFRLCWWPILWSQGLELELWLMFERHRGKTTNEVVVQLDEHHAVGVGTAV